MGRFDTSVALVLRNGLIRTMDPAAPTADSVAISRTGRILGVGTEADLAGFRIAADRTIDLGGRVLLPGFFDCHMHLLWLGVNLGQVNLASPPVRTIEEIVLMLRARHAEQPDLTCIQGNRYDQNLLEERRHPTRQDLDRVSQGLPVRIVHTSGHAAVVNSKALELLGYAAETADPPGGQIVRDARGAPTGVLLETASWSHLERILPEISPAERVEALGRASSYVVERGITSATDANTRPQDIPVYARAVENGTLQARTNLMVSWAEVMEQAGETFTPTPHDLQPSEPGVSWHRLHVGQAKLFSDGAITTRTCWLTEPFLGMPDHHGIPIHPPEELHALIRRAHVAGWQIATHAIGDRAIDLVLTAYAEAQRAHTRRYPGHRIEHAMLLTPALIARLRRQNIWAIGQPEFLEALGDAYVTALGLERARRLNPYASLDAAGVAQAFSSDCPVVSGAPLDGLRAAQERRTRSGAVLNEEERLPAETALYAYTAAPAFATRTDRDRGSISPGKWADFVVLSDDPVAAEETVRVDATLIAGETHYGEI